MFQRAVSEESTELDKGKKASQWSLEVPSI